MTSKSDFIDKLKSLKESDFVEWVNNADESKQLGITCCCESCPLSEFIYEKTGVRISVGHDSLCLADDKYSAMMETQKWMTILISKVDNIHYLREEFVYKRDILAVL